MIPVVLSLDPARFITPNPGPKEGPEAQIAELATGLDGNDAFVIFPEGGNFTPQRRQRAIDRLRRLGMDRMAHRAEQMIHVLAPEPGGFLAALDAAPEADVVVGAQHRLGPHGHRRRGVARAADGQADHHAPGGTSWNSDIPVGRDERIEWLFGWWERIDAWIAENRPVELSTDRP